MRSSPTAAHIPSTRRRPWLGWLAATASAAIAGQVEAQGATADSSQDLTPGGAPRVSPVNPQTVQAKAQKAELTEPEAARLQTEPNAPAETSNPNGASPEPHAPWRISKAMRLPNWLWLSATHRTRTEYLWNSFRAGLPGDGGALSLRSTLAAELRFKPLFVGAEALDARLYLPGQSTVLNTTHINTIGLLQAYVGLRGEDVLQGGDSVVVRAGRLTMDVGSRRFSARNIFRNTINAFTGVDGQWRTNRDDALRVFATLPVRRRPEDRPSLLNNRVQADRESLSTLFWGGHFRSRTTVAKMRIEAFVLGLHESDSSIGDTRDRRLVTPGFRLHRAPNRGAWDLDIEAALQTGRSRSSAEPEDNQDLTHLAVFGHGAWGYTFDFKSKPRLVLQYDYASGDRSPDDDRNGRFDTLFGARRFEFGPTGIYGALARSNLLTPGLRVEVQPHSRVDGFVGYRPVWLAQARDSWTTSGIRDPTGQSGRFVGQQLEARLRWRPLPGNLVVDIGVAHTFLGGFPRSAPNSAGGSSSSGGSSDSDNPGQSDPTYVYSQIGLEI